MNQLRKDYAAKCFLDEGNLKAYSKTQLWAFMQHCYDLTPDKGDDYNDERRIYKKSSPDEYREHLQISLSPEAFISLRDERLKQRNVPKHRTQLRGLLHGLPARNGCSSAIAEALPDSEFHAAPKIHPDEYYITHLTNRLVKWTDSTPLRTRALGALILLAGGDQAKIAKEHRAWFTTEVEKLTGIKSPPAEIVQEVRLHVCPNRRGVVIIDDKEENLKGVGEKCPCVMPIKCKRGKVVENVEQWKRYVRRLDVPGKNVATAMLRWLGVQPAKKRNKVPVSAHAAAYDPWAVLDAGIDAKIAGPVTAALKANELQSALLDWDRTVTTHIGHLPLRAKGDDGDDFKDGTVADVVKALSEFGKDITADGVVSYYLGGPKRVQMIKELMDAAQKSEVRKGKGRQAVILTTNTNKLFIDSALKQLQQANATKYIRSMTEYDNRPGVKTKLDYIKSVAMVCDDYAHLKPCKIPTGIQPLIYGKWKVHPR